MSDDKKLYDLSAAIDKRLSKLESERGSSTTANVALFLVIYLWYVFHTYVDLGAYIQYVIP